MHHRAICNDSYLTTVAKNFALADFKYLRRSRNVGAYTIASRVTHRRWSYVFHHRQQHVAHLAFIFRRHDDQVGNGAKISDIEQAVVGWAITAGQTTAIQTELNIEILNTNVMD